MFTVSGVTLEAAMIKSPSFSRFSSSVTMISLPAAISAMADSTESKGGWAEALMQGCEPSTFLRRSGVSTRDPAACRSGFMPRLTAQRPNSSRRKAAPTAGRLRLEINHVRLTHRLFGFRRFLQERDVQLEHIRWPDAA